MSESDVRDAAWAIVRNSRVLNDSGHGRAVRWARAYLGLTDEPRRPSEPWEPRSGRPA